MRKSSVRASGLGSVLVGTLTKFDERKWAHKT